jgi:hypothetical protein
MIKYLWRLGSFFFGLLALSGCIELVLRLTRRYFANDDLVGLVMISVAATLCLLCHDKAKNSDKRESNKDPEQKA